VQFDQKLWDDRMTRGMLAGSQTTLRATATVTGIGVHSGSPATLTLHPAEANTGIIFLRTGLDGQRDR
jgi:UDP-3-O-[3-hydroxymyristoyl] N-acetylglucosamine deacetylase